jgi:transcriptional regulator with XRE-family HTH domain
LKGCDIIETKIHGRSQKKEVYREIVARRLKEAREAAGYTQDDVQKLMKYKSRGTLSHYELGKRINPGELPRLAALYHVTLDWLYGESNKKSASRMEEEELLTDRERKVLQNFRNASERGQNLVETMLEEMSTEKKHG